MSDNLDALRQRALHALDRMETESHERDEWRRNTLAAKMDKTLATHDLLKSSEVHISNETHIALIKEAYEGNVILGGMPIPFGSKISKWYGLSVVIDNSVAFGEAVVK